MILARIFILAQTSFKAIIMVAWYSFTVQSLYLNCNLVCMYYQLYEHVHAELYVIVLHDPKYKPVCIPPIQRATLNIQQRVYL